MYVPIGPTEIPVLERNVNILIGVQKRTPLLRLMLYKMFPRASGNKTPIHQNSSW